MTRLDKACGVTNLAGLSNLTPSLEQSLWCDHSPLGQGQRCDHCPLRQGQRCDHCPLRQGQRCDHCPLRQGQRCDHCPLEQGQRCDHCPLGQGQRCDLAVRTLQPGSSIGPTVGVVGMVECPDFLPVSAIGGHLCCE